MSRFEFLSSKQSLGAGNLKGRAVSKLSVLGSHGDHKQVNGISWKKSGTSPGFLFFHGNH
jgi:hypothetical protein